MFSYTYATQYANVSPGKKTRLFYLSSNRKELLLRQYLYQAPECLAAMLITHRDNREASRCFKLWLNKIISYKRSSNTDL